MNQTRCTPRHTSLQRSDRGMFLVEMLVALMVGSLIMLAIYGMAMASYRSSSSAQSQILATNMAQQLVDNARDCTFSRLITKLNGNITVQESVPLYTTPTGNSPLYPRALLRNPGLIYTTQASNQKFNGTVTETLLNLTPGATASRMIQLNIDIVWIDANGHHVYATSTMISEDGIHN